jgi:UDP-N-acetylmuramyl pentapeptide phosphotransferase/UDP-N-acetylglucosamine-1-phosphate transferase
LASIALIWILGFECALQSGLATRFAIAYAARARMIDEPGARRSHSTPTPRGGGIGIVLAVLAFGLFPLTLPVTAKLGVAVAAVAIVGWIDDHRGLPALPRFAVHLAAAALLAHGWFAEWYVSLGLTAYVAFLFAGGTLWLAWSINLHNFMDGINALLAMQTVFVAATIGGFAYAAHDAWTAQSCAVLAAATLAFLPLNFPAARVFMGDVGSGAIGLVLGWLLLGVAMGSAGLGGPGAALIIGSAFLVDATLTLVARMAAGKRWYEPHREHLYQWLVRAGLSHAQVVGCYALWNVLVVLPAYVAQRALAPPGGGVTLYSAVVPVAVLALGCIAWVRGKRACLDRVKGSI